MYFIILFCLVQGFTEFLPISSQGHLILFNNFFPFPYIYEINILHANVLVHFGSLLAVIFYYRKLCFNLLKSIKLIYRPDIERNAFILNNLIISSIPVSIIGLFFSKYFDYTSDSIFLIIGILSIVFGIFLLIVDNYCLRIKNLDHMNFGVALIIGITQCLALVPGVSRSGSVISFMRFLGFQRKFCVFYSNLLSIPVIFGAIILISMTQPISLNLFSSFSSYILIFSSFLFSIFFIHFLVSWVENSSLLIFVIYRILFGVALLIFF